MPVTRGFRVATIFGLPIRIDATWFLILALLSWTLAVNYFPHVHEGLPRSSYWLLGLAAAVLLFFSVLLHELGHAVAALRWGLRVEGITLFMFGGVSELAEEPASAGAEAEVTLSGWLVSAALAIVAYALSLLFRGESATASVLRILFQYLALANAILFIFNAIPAFPLDGGRLLRAGLWQLTGSLRKSTYIASTIGSGFGLFLIAVGVLNFFAGQFVGGMWYALIGMFVRNAAQAGYHQMLLRRALEGVPVAQLMTADVITAPPDITADELVRDYFMRHHVHSFPVVRDGELLGLVTLANVRDLDEDQRAVRSVADILPDAETGGVPTLSPDQDAMEALALMAATGRGRLPVVENGELAGIVSRRDIMHFLAVKTDLLPEAQ